MAKVKLEIELETFEFLKKLANRLNEKEITKVRTANENGEYETTTVENTSKFPFWTVDHTILTAVPPGEGDMQEFWFKGDKVYGSQVKDYCTKHNIDFTEFAKEAQHVCDHKEVEQFEGFFLTEEACQDYIEANRDKYKYPYPVQKSFEDNEQMKSVIQALFAITDTQPNERYTNE